MKDYQKEDYGQTLGSWGMGEGCYLVLPILGPSTVRDLAGTLTGVLGGDPWYNITVKNDTQYFKDSDYYFTKSGDGINFRLKIDSFENLKKINGLLCFSKKSNFKIVEKNIKFR